MIARLFERILPSSALKWGRLDSERWHHERRMAERRRVVAWAIQQMPEGRLRLTPGQIRTLRRGWEDRP